jgi:hypothetical protein
MIRKQVITTGCVLGAVAAAIAVSAPAARASVNFNGTNSMWWFDAGNWAGGNLPPFSNSNVDGNGKYSGFGADTDINNGFTTGDGVVFDPVNDPNYNTSASVATNRPTGGGTGTTDLNFPYAPFSIYRLYLSSGNTNSNMLSIKSGTLRLQDANGGTATGGYAIIGRQGTGTVNQTGGTFIVNNDALDLGSNQNSVGGTGTWNYHGGSIEVAMSSGATSTTGIRVGAGASSNGTMRIYNNGADGHIRAITFSTAANATATGLVEFHLGQNTHGDPGVRTVEVGGSLKCSSTVGASRLSLILDTAPVFSGVDGSGNYIPQNLGLFDVAYSNTAGSISGSFYSADGSTQYTEGSVISATYGGFTYNWTVSYKGNIDWTSGNADTSLGAIITADGSGKDMVLVGLSSNQPAAAVPEPASLGVLTIGALSLLARRRRA